MDDLCLVWHFAFKTSHFRLKQMWYDKVFVRHSASISKFEWFEQLCLHADMIFFWTPLESTFPLNDPWHFRQEDFSKIHGGHQLGRGLSDFTLTPIQRCTLTILMIKCKHNFKMSLLKNCKTYLHKIKSKWKLINTIFFGALFKNSQPN